MRTRLNKAPEVLQGISHLMAHSGRHTEDNTTQRTEHLTQIGAVALSEDTSRNLGFKSRSMTTSDDVPFVDQIFVFVTGGSTAKKPEIY